MAVFEYLTSAPSGGNPVYISDLTKFASLIQTLAKVTTRHNSYNTSTSSIVKDIAILSGFDTVGNNQVTPGYIYYKGDIYGFRSDNNLTLGGYLIATKTNTTLRTTKEGTDFYAYTSCELSVSASEGTSGNTVGAFTAANIAIWKTFTPTSIGITIPNEFITTPMLGREIIRAANIASGTIQLKNMANNSIGTYQIIDGAVTSNKIATNAVTNTQLGNDVVSLILSQKPEFIDYSFLDGNLTVYKEIHSNIWHIQYYDTTTEVPEGLVSFSKSLGSITGAGSTEFIAMIKRNYPNNIYRSSMFQTNSGKFFYLQIDYDGGVLASFSGSTDLKSVGLSMHDTIIGV
jgi:hypothetical protein